MQGDNNIIIYLNRLLNNELNAVNQYFLHAAIFKNWGLERLNNVEYKECMNELYHANYYTKRILFLEGIPVLKLDNYDSLNVNKNIENILRADLNLEYHSVNNLKESIKYADSVQDYVSKDIMIRVLKDEEQHIDFIEKELDLIEQVGLHNYVQTQIKKGC